MREKLRKPWERERSITEFEGESQTDTSSGNDTDVNHIVARFARTGQLPPATREGYFGDVTHLQGDLTEMIERGKAAQKELERLQEAASAETTNDDKREGNLDQSHANNDEGITAQPAATESGT